MSRSVIVVGGGASGLAAAIAAAECGAAVTVLERLPRVGKKLLLTGNGRCNLGHEGFAWQHYHGTLPQARRIMEQFDVKAYFRRYGLYTRTDSEGRIYPMSGTAASVLDALRFAAAQRDVTVKCEMQVTGLRQSGGQWIVQCGEASCKADAVVLAAGGSAAPACGTDGSLFPILKKMGYVLTRPRPSLCPVLTEPARVRALKGLRVRAAVTARQGGKVLKTESGEVQFTDSALSGICVFNLSRYAAGFGDAEQRNRPAAELSLDLLPDLNEAETAALLQTLLRQRGSLPAGDLLTGLLPKRIAEALFKQSGGSCNLPAAQCSAETIQTLIRLLHDWTFPANGCAGFAQAQVTAGGIAGQCVNRDLSSRLHKGLYFCGELLDLDADCGGWNLTWCWASGKCAGTNAAKGTEQ